MKTEIDKQQEFITELNGKIQWMEDSLEDYKFISEVWENANNLIESEVKSAVEAGEYAKRALRFTDLDEIDNTEIDEVGMSMDAINDGTAFAPNT